MNGITVKSMMIGSEAGGDEEIWPVMPTIMPTVMPTETEIYLLPDGRVIIADMPIELTELVNELNGDFPEDE